MKPITELQLILLLIVREEQPVHGHRLRKAIPRYTGGVLKGHLSSTYEALYKLEELGYLASYEEIVEGRRRRLYTLTGAGASAIDNQGLLIKRTHDLIQLRPLREGTSNA